MWVVILSHPSVFHPVSNLGVTEERRERLIMQLEFGFYTFMPCLNFSKIAIKVNHQCSTPRKS
jgi:hypothetical protein